MPRTTIADIAAKALVLACVLNLNGVAHMMFDVGQAVSMVMLSASLILVVRCGSLASSMPFQLLILALLTYLLFGAFHHDAIRNSNPLSKYILTYGSTILMMTGMTGYTVYIARKGLLPHFLRFTRNVLVISASAVWISPLLYQFYANVPPSSQSRMGGLFGNPNEAGYVALLALGFVAGLQYRHFLVQVCAIALCSGAVVLTFSKTCIALLVAFAGWHLIFRTRGVLRVMTAFLVAIAVLIIWDVNSAARLISDQQIIELNNEQKRRLLAVETALSGQIDTEVTTGRTDLWLLGFDRALDWFPFGQGLGSYHFLVGGIFESGVWQGVHNTFLMFWGEAGVVPALLLLLAVVAMFAYIRLYALGTIEQWCAIVLLANMMVGHTSMSLRYHNIVLAIILGLVAFASHQRNRARMPQSRATPAIGRERLAAFPRE